MMDNIKCKDQCQDCVCCSWPRDLNNSGKIQIDICMPPTMDLKGNGNKESRIVLVVFGLMLQALLVWNEFLSMDFMSMEQNRTQMITEEAVRILLLYLTLELLEDRKCVLLLRLLIKDFGKITESYFQMILGNKGIGGRRCKSVFEKGQISLREHLDMPSFNSIEDDDDTRNPHRVFITGSNGEDGERRKKEGKEK